MFKRIFVTAGIMCCFLQYSIYASNELNFEPVGGGKFIYCNNAEGITDSDLMNGDIPSYIMNNENLTPDTYQLYLSHFNYTGNGKRGYDIELDVEITANEDSIINIEKAFFETPEKYAWYRHDGTYVMSEDNWGSLNVCASMLERDIITTDDREYSYKAQKYSSIRLELEKGETIWLSEYMDDYRKVHFCCGVHIQALIEIISGELDMNVAAFRSGEEVGDRTSFTKTARFGTFKRDRCHKGIADTLPKVETSLEYTITDDIKDGEALPVTVINQYVPEGAELNYWYTHLNPIDDKWAKYALAESDMIQLKYKDDSKLEFYGKNVPETERDNVWVFDTKHSDTKEYEAGFGTVAPEDYIPNFIMTPAEDYMNCACCMGNYGVETTYNLTVNNQSKRDRYFCYYATTASDLLVYDEGNSPIRQKYWGKNGEPQKLYMKKIPADSSQTFSICVQLPVNYNGGIKNEFIVEDDVDKKFNNLEFRERPTIKREYVLLSEYADKLPEETLKNFEGSLDCYEIVAGNRSYIVRWCAWDGKPSFYYMSWGYCNTIYILDEDFNITGTTQLEGKMPVASVFNDGVYYILDASWKKFSLSKNGEWEIYSGEMPQSKPYYDIENASDWAQTVLEDSYDIGIRLDEDDGDFAFTEGITRGDFCKLAVQLLEAEESIPDEYTEKSFSDTKDKDILMLSGIGIINGFDNGTFGADILITREQAAAILDRLSSYLGIKIIRSENVFDDADEFSSWAVENIYNMNGTGIMLGTGDNNFSPQENYSREQSVVTMWRITERVLLQGVVF